MKFKITKTFNKLIIYDFDDTLVSTNAKIKIIKKNGEILELNSSEYSNYTHQADDEIDFSDFRQSKLVEPKITELFDKKFINDMLDDEADVAILTARPSIEQLVEFFYVILPELGYNFTKDELRRINFISIGKDAHTGEIAAKKKKEWINQQIFKYGYDSVTFYDDSEQNIKFVDELKDEWSNIDIKTVKIDA